MKLVAELQRRNVIRMAGLYLVGAWLVTQVAGTILPMFGAPDWVARTVVILLAIGFIPALVFSWVFELTPEGLKRDDEVTANESIAPQTAQRLNRMLLVVMALALGYFALDKFVLAPGREASSDPAANTAQEAAATPGVDIAAPAVATQSIAVLAFANMSADPDNEYFSDGVAEEILNALAKIDDLKVAGRTSSFYFKGRNETLAAIGSTLGVAHVLEGSVRKQGDRLRISAKLLRVSDGVEMWADTFDGTDADIFALQENVAREVAGQMKVALSAGQQSRLVDIGTNDPSAYALYLRATDIFNRRDTLQFDQAIAALQQALQRDPKFARAHSRLATLHSVSTLFAATSDRYRDATEQALLHAEQALQLNPLLAEPHAVMGAMHRNGRRFGAAQAAYDRALQLDAADVTANFWSALLKCATGYVSRCEKGLDDTLAIDPILPIALAWRARMRLAEGDLESAEGLLERAHVVGYRGAWLVESWIALERGDLEDARKQTFDLITAVGVGLPPDAAQWIAGARTGDAQARARTLKFIDEYLADPPAPIDGLIPWSLVAIGEVDRGLTTFADYPTQNDLALLGDAMGGRGRLVPEAWASPVFPEFLRKSGIAEYWDEFGPPEQCRKLANGDYRCE